MEQNSNYSSNQQTGYNPPMQQGFGPQGQQGFTPYTQQRVDQTPLTLGQYLIMFLLMAIPIANIVMMFVWAFGDSNLNKKNFARAALIWLGISIVLGVLFATMIISITSNMYYY